MIESITRDIMEGLSDDLQIVLRKNVCKMDYSFFNQFVIITVS